MPDGCERWLKDFPRPDKDSHKYSRGHAIVLGGARMTGAARLASQAAMRMGAGLCTIVADDSARQIYLSDAPHILFEVLASPSDFASHFFEPRRTAALLGPGAGQDRPEALRDAVLSSLALAKPAVLDADALTVFAGASEALFQATRKNGRVVVTPHEGEFGRLFPGFAGDRADRARRAAALSGAVVVLKGAETLIAGPDGAFCVNSHATPYLATAGAGDVLAGMITGLLAQRMPCFEAACAAAWIHGDAGLRCGPGLVAPDLIAALPSVLRDILPS